MDKKDLAFFGAAIAIVIVVALIGKPLLMGEPISILPSSEPSVDPNAPLPIPSILPTPLPPRATETPLPTPTWDGEVKTVSYVDPSTYNIEIPKQPVIGPQPTQYQQNHNMTPYAIIQGEASGVTEVLTIPPSGYWEMHITFDTWTDSPIQSFLELQIRNAEDRSDYQVFNSATEGPPVLFRIRRSRTSGSSNDMMRAVFILSSKKNC
ncbi:hypothetical protein [Methanogenium cariaci]|uniref:hypothetical protein n=1 Tax=Methanogenium cariaci TaxID=2197 RepID=UPI000783E016|nr:hypothetical protein [Methanogenium cariaci]